METPKWVKILAIAMWDARPTRSQEASRPLWRGEFVFLRASVSLVKTLSHSASHGRRDHAQLIHQFSELIGEQRLRAI